MRGTAESEVLQSVIEIVAAVNGPIVAATIHVTADGTMADIGSKKATAAVFFPQRTVEVRQIENRHVFQTEDGMARDGPLSGNDVKNGCIKSPPGFGHFAIGNKAMVEDIAVSDPVGPDRLKVEGIGGRQDTRAGHNFCGRGAADTIEF